MNKIFSEQMGAEVKEFDFSQPVINIGRHPENDIVLYGTDVLPFHATLAADGEEFQLIALDSPSLLKIDGKALDTSPVIVTPQQRIEIGQHSFFFKPNNGKGGMHVRMLSLENGGALSYQPEISTYQGEAPILVNIVGQMAEIDVDQTAYFDLEIINAGQIVAGFSASITGVPESWVTVTPRLVNLNEGQRATMRISITPPRDPSSTAGKHTVIAMIGSSNYPGFQATTQLGLTIKPYYEFSVGGLSPKQQNIFWSKKSSVTKLPIINQGNSTADFSVSAVDDENGCNFDFLLGDDKQVSRQSILSVPSGATMTLPIEITPLKQPMISMRVRRYHYTTTIQLTQQGLTPQSLSGTVTTIPLIGWWSIVLSIALLLLGLFFLIQPRIFNFEVAAQKDVIEKGDTTQLEWRVSPFATRLSLSNIEQALNYGQTSLTIAPTQSTTYDLVAGNWLSGLMGLDWKKSLTVLVVPPTPNINVFEVDNTRVPQGVPITLRWSVTKADQAFLTVDQVVYELKPDEFSGERSVAIPKDALVTLEAKNASGSQLRSYYINVVPPNIKVNSFTVWVRPQTTASVPTLNPTFAHLGGKMLFAPSEVPPDPNFPDKYVELVPDKSSDSGYRPEFYEPDRELSKGEQVIVAWNVLGVDKDKVQIAPFTEALPARGAQPFFPQESMNFVMTAKSGDLEKLFMLPVKVFDGTPPTAPKIDFFRATPVRSVGPTNVQFSWSVSGEWTNVQLLTEGKVVADHLNAQGFKTIHVNKSTTYILTAFNGKLSSASPLEITIDPSLIPVNLAIQSVVPNSSSYLVGDQVAVTVAFGTLPTDKPKPTGKIIVSDGIASCEITLPATGCTLTFKASGTKVNIIASYLGDTIYLQADSAPVTVAVSRATVTLKPSFFKLVPPNTQGATLDPLSSNPIQLTDGLYIHVDVIPDQINLPSSNGGFIALRICTQTGSATYDAASCKTITSKSVVVNTANGTGSADFAISSLPRAGNDLVLVFDYSHPDNLFDKVSYPDFDLSVQRLPILLRLNLCTNTPTPFTNCLISINPSGATTVTFDIYEGDGVTLLPSSLPAPVSSDFAVWHLYNSSKTDWSCAVITSSGFYKLECTVVLVAGNTVSVQYTYNNLSSVNYSMGAVPVSNTYSSAPFNLAVRLTSNILWTASNVDVGQKVVLTSATSPASGAVKLTLNDTNQTPITSGTGSITITSLAGPGIFGLEPGTSCSVSPDGSTVTINSIASDCAVYFKVAGSSFPLSLAFAGDSLYMPGAGSGSVTVNQQNKIALTWQSSSTAGNYQPWGSQQGTLLLNTTRYVRIILTPPSNLVLNSLTNEKLRITLAAGNTTAGSTCSLTSGSITKTFTGTSSIDIPIVSSSGIAYVDFNLSCNTDRNQVTLTAGFVNSNFALDPTTTGSQTFYIVTSTSSGPAGASMTVQFTRDNGMDVPTSIANLYVGETYKVKINIGTLWADSNVRIIDSINAYTQTNAAITLPLSIYNRIDTVNSTCPTDSINKQVVIRMDSYTASMMIPNDPTQPGISDIHIFNAIACTLVFTPGTDITLPTNSTVLFSYNTTAPYYGFQISLNKTYSTNGLTKQTAGISFAPALPGIGWVGYGVPYTITLTPNDSTHNPIDDTTKGFGAYFAFTIPLSGGNPCATISNQTIVNGTTATFTLTPTQVCSVGKIVYHYYGNNWYYDGGDVQAAVDVNFQAQKTTTVATPTSSANPSTYGQSVTLSTTVTASPTGTITGTVTFMEGATPLCSDITLPGGAASCSISTLSVGTHTITATYTPDTGEFTSGTSAASLTQTVNKAIPTFTLSPTSPTSIVVGNSITITASVTGSAGVSAPTGSLTFTDTTTSTTLCTSVPLSTSSCTPAPNLAVGSHAITVTYTGDANYNNATQNLTVNVNKATPGVTAPSPSPASTTIFVGDSISFTTTVSGVAGVSAPTGTVDFKDGATTLCATVALGGTCGPITTLAAGTHNITAVYSGDSNYTTLTSGALTVTVNKHVSSASGLELENPANTWSAFPFNTAGSKATVATNYKLRTTVTDNDSPAHALTPTGVVEIWLWNNTDGTLVTNTDYTITQVVGEGAVTYLGTNHYTVALDASGMAVFTINFKNTLPTNKDLIIRYQYNGSSIFSSDPLSTATPSYKVSTAFRVQ